MKRTLIMAGLLIFLPGMFSAVSLAKEYQIAEVYTGLRYKVLTTQPGSIGLYPSAAEVWGVVMEMGYPEAVVSLVALGDGTVSVYFSNGGGRIGLGPHRGPQRAAKAFLSLAQQFPKACKTAKDYPLPQPTFTRFYLLTGNGVVTAEAKADELGQRCHPLSPLFLKGHELISEIRAVDEKARAK